MEAYYKELLNKHGVLADLEKRFPISDATNPLKYYTKLFLGSLYAGFSYDAHRMFSQWFKFDGVKLPREIFEEFKKRYPVRAALRWNGLIDVLNEYHSHAWVDFDEFEVPAEKLTLYRRVEGQAKLLCETKRSGELIHVICYTTSSHINLINGNICIRGVDVVMEYDNTLIAHAQSLMKVTN